MVRTKQEEIPGTELDEDVEPFTFRFELKLKITPMEGHYGSYILPIARGDCPGDRVEEMLRKGLNSERFQSALAAVITGRQILNSI